MADGLSSICHFFVYFYTPHLLNITGKIALISTTGATTIGDGSHSSSVELGVCLLSLLTQQLHISAGTEQIRVVLHQPDRMYQIAKEVVWHTPEYLI